MSDRKEMIAQLAQALETRYGPVEAQCGGVLLEQHWMTRQEKGAELPSKSQKLSESEQALLDLLRPYVLDRLEKRLLAEVGGTMQ